MKRLISIAGVICVTWLLVSCGGGGGDSTGGVGPGGSSGTTGAQTLNASSYAGNYVWACQPLKNGTNYETGAPLYVKLVLSVVSASPGPVTLTSPRFDFYDDSACTGTALATLQIYGNSSLYLVSETTANGAIVDKVVLSFGAVSSASYAPGPTADTVLYGTVLRLQLPRFLVSGFYVQDLWSLQNNALYEGNTTYGPDGYPQALLTTPLVTKVAQFPPVAGAPCGGMQVIGWSAPPATLLCNANTVPAGSGRSIQLVDTQGSSVSGTATTTCNNGSWSSPTNRFCDFTYVPVTCPARTFSWTSGSNTCSGSVPLTYAGNTSSMINITAGLDGGQYMSCQNDGTWATWAGTTGRCDVIPPPITDPQQLAQAKNCLACHRVTGADLVGPSFQRIANFYRASPPAAGVLENKVKAGGVGVFGTTAMPANSQVSDADLAILIPWILAQPQ